jgi:ribosomal protein S18 acetylase RimI-like enzyme
MPNQDIFIRTLGPEAYDHLLRLWQQAGLRSLRPDGRDSRHALARQLATGVQKILGLYVGERLRAAVVVTHDSRKGWINCLAVDPDCRHHGYATRLGTAAEDSLSSQGIRVIAALVEGDNAASLALFRKCGYNEIDEGIHYLTKRLSEDA